MASSVETPPQKVQTAAAPGIQLDPALRSGSEDSSWKIAAVVLCTCSDLR